MKVGKPLACFLAGSLMNFATAFADTQLGNGGDAVVCRSENGEIVSVRLLDFYEKDAIGREFDIDLGASEIDPVEKVRIALNRLRRLDVPRANYYEGELNEFFSKVTWSNTNLVPVHDEGLTIEPECPIQQLALQRNPLVPGDGQYMINKSLWDKLDNDGRAGLILHEIVYHEGIENGHQDSFKARFLNVAILSHQMQTIALDSYSDLIGQLTYPQSVIYWKSSDTGTQWALTNRVSYWRPTPQNPRPPLPDRMKICETTIEGGRETYAGENMLFRSKIGRTILNQTRFGYGYYSVADRDLKCFKLEENCMAGRGCTITSFDDRSCQGAFKRLCIVEP